MRKTAWMLAGLLAALPLGAALAADGDTAEAGQTSWARWQGRLSLGITSAPWRLGADAPASRLGSASLMGDYYFGNSFATGSLLGGFRATSGLVFGSRALPNAGQPSLANGSAFSIGNRPSGQAAAPNSIDPYADTTTQPDVGFGYTALSVRSGLGFSADLGLLARGSAAGRTALSSQGLDDAIRQLRMTPLLQLGVSYAF